MLECGLVRPSFVPPADIRWLRMLTRYRLQLMGDRTRGITRAGADAGGRLDQTLLRGGQPHVKYKIRDNGVFERALGYIREYY